MEHSNILFEKYSQISENIQLKVQNITNTSVM